MKRASLLAAVLLPLLVWRESPQALAADPDYTIMVLPDPQYLVYTCSPQILNVMMNWIKDNKNANLGNTDQGTNLTLSTKALIGVGDTNQQASATVPNTIISGSTTSGFGILDNAHIPFVQPPGNHDYVEPTTDHTVLSADFASGGFLSASYRQAHGYWDNVTSFWGDKYDEANYYVRFKIGSRNILVYSIEYQPRAAVLTWAKGIHDTYPGYENIISTHSFLTDSTGMLSRYSGESGWTASIGDNSGWGLKTTQSTSDASFNSGLTMWNSYLNAWTNLTMVLNGHWIATENHYASSPTRYHYQTLGLTSTSSRGQNVLAIFNNFQDTDYEYNGTTNFVDNSNEYPSWRNFSPDGAPAGPCTSPGNCTNPDSPRYCPDLGAHFRNGHVMILQFRPSLGTVEGYIIATSNGRWEPTAANYTSHMSASPIRLFSLAYDGIPRGVFPMPGAARR